jgi:hypothetical protein
MCLGLTIDYLSKGQSINILQSTLKWKKTHHMVPQSKLSHASNLKHFALKDITRIGSWVNHIAPVLA